MVVEAPAKFQANPWTPRWSNLKKYMTRLHRNQASVNFAQFTHYVLWGFRRGPRNFHYARQLACRRHSSSFLIEETSLHFTMSDAAPAKKATKAKKPAKKADHPPVASMVNAAITNLKDRKGSSLAAIKKYIAANNKVDVAKLAPFIKKGLKNLVEKKVLIQTKGKGASGSFKVAKVEKKEKKPAKPKAKKPAAKKTKAAGT